MIWRRAKRIYEEEVSNAVQGLQDAENRLTAIKKDDAKINRLSDRMAEINNRNGLGLLIMKVYRGST